MLSLLIAHCGGGTVGACGQDSKPGGRLDPVTMRHPDRVVPAGSRGLSCDWISAGPYSRSLLAATAHPAHAPLAACRSRCPRPAGRARAHRRAAGGAGFIDRRRPAGEDIALGLQGQHLLCGGIPGEKLAVYLGLTHPASDELCILRAEIEDDQGIAHWSIMALHSPGCKGKGNKHRFFHQRVFSLMSHCESLEEG